MVAPDQGDIVKAEREMEAAMAPPLPTLQDIAPQGFEDAPEVIEELTADEVPAGGL